MVICDDLLSRFPEASEGELAKAKAFLASEPILATASRALGIDAAVELSAAEEASGGRNRRSILADAFEAVVAAVYLDQGMRSAKRLVRRALKEATHRVATSEYSHDYKSRLQELLQATDRRTPHYRISATSGAHHDRTFTAEALSGRRVIGAGVGKSKKEAEQAAARAALETPDGSNRRGSGAHGPGGSDG
jgi:ribonuclease-3